MIEKCRKMLLVTCSLESLNFLATNLVKVAPLSSNFIVGIPEKGCIVIYPYQVQQIDNLSFFFVLTHVKVWVVPINFLDTHLVWVLGTNHQAKMSLR